MTRMQRIPFSGKEDNIIKEVMEGLDDKQRNCYKIVQNVLARNSIQRSLKQIRQRYKNNLDKKLWKEPLKVYEQDFVIQWIENNQPNGKISYANLSNVMKNSFGKLFSENKLKNFWNSRKRTENLRAKRKLINQAPSIIRPIPRYPTNFYFRSQTPNFTDSSLRNQAVVSSSEIPSISN
ncbi:4408_t:CDS:2 [Funneliformis geosporum]|uniref:13011_t:CDS:1 n=1 Tax=Funneliformis geosporum TaxID=1117311 RepID=A0A9W4WK87_9GLOM|nr:13011_t:CDS:2 [Funneliformis geosporum]CAI2191925.1 4408_t:CDS:2 [Funneliformis geosporum]